MKLEDKLVTQIIVEQLRAAYDAIRTAPNPTVEERMRAHFNGVVKGLLMVCGAHEVEYWVALVQTS